MKKTKRQIILSGTVLVYMFFATIPVLANDATTTRPRAGIKEDRAILKADIKEKRESFRSEAKSDRSQLKAGIKDKVDAMRVDVKAMKEAGATPEQIKAKIEEVKVANQADREAFRAELEEKRKTMKDEITKEINAFKEGKKVKLTEESRSQVKQKLSASFAKLSGAIGRLAGFDRKVSDEILSRKAKGLDVSAAESALEMARRSLEEAKVTVASVNSAVNANVDASTSASKEAVKSAVNTALASIKAAREKYNDVLKALPKVSEDDAEVTTTTTK